MRQLEKAGSNKESRGKVNLQSYKLILRSMALFTPGFLLMVSFTNCSGSQFKSVSLASQSPLQNRNSTPPTTDNPNPIQRSCSVAGQIFDPGISINGYPMSTAVFPILCGAPVSRTCLSSGQFNGSVPLSDTCLQMCQNPDSKLPSNPGSEIVYFSKSTAPTQEECDAAKIISTCSSSTGQFMPTPPALNTRFSTCLVQGQTCAYTSSTGTANPDGNSVGAKVTGYETQISVYPSRCGSPATATCQTNGQWSMATPLYTNCTQKCLHPDSNMPSDGGSQLTFYKIGSGTKTQCEAAKVISICSSMTGQFSPEPPATNLRFSSCSVIVPPTPTPTPTPNPTPVPTPTPMPTPTPTPNPTPTPPVTSDILGLGACVASGQGKDYQIGTGAGQLASLDLVPWESLHAGDTVRIFYSSTAYKGKFVLSGQGTVSAPIRVCGVKGPNGERPIVDGNGASTRANSLIGSTAVQSRGLVLIKTLEGQSAIPKFVQIDGLVLKSAHPNYSFKNTTGASQKYAEFGACVWVENGQNVTIADNEITDCTQGIFSTSIDGSESTLTRNLRIAGNIFTNNGLSGVALNHTNYIQTIGVIYEFNRYGALKSGALGNSLKDRSVGSIIRYNRFEAGTRAMDLVDAEEHKETAKADPNYRHTYVYGNQIIKSGREVVHYGGDHPGSEPYFRKGTLYFFNNSVYTTGNTYLFQITTTEENVEAWNNAIYSSSGTLYLRSEDYPDSGYTTGGNLNLGRNWISSTYKDNAGGLGGQLNGANNLITGSVLPFDKDSFLPTTGSPLIDQATTGPTAAASLTVDKQLNANRLPVLRIKSGAGNDLGAVEK